MKVEQKMQKIKNDKRGKNIVAKVLEGTKEEVNDTLEKIAGKYFGITADGSQVI